VLAHRTQGRKGGIVVWLRKTAIEPCGAADLHVPNRPRTILPNQSTGKCGVHGRCRGIGTTIAQDRRQVSFVPDRRGAPRKTAAATQVRRGRGSGRPLTACGASPDAPAGPCS